MQDVKELPVLIMAFQRVDNLKLIVERCMEAGIREIYVSVDGPLPENPEQQINYRLIIQYLNLLSVNPNLRICINLNEHNLGCSVSILRALDWFFGLVDLGVILEDDCIPEVSFFSYVFDGLEYINDNAHCMIVSGSQFWRSPELKSGNVISTYPLIWGWATTKLKWHLLSDLMEKEVNMTTFHYPWLGSPDHVFWHAGLRRSVLGYIDAWDSILAFIFYRDGFEALLPHTSLISNIGNDQYAIHQMSQNRQIGIESQAYVPGERAPKIDTEMDKWIRINVYQINWVKWVTTKLTFLLDYFGMNRKVCDPLRLHWRIKQD